MSLQGELCDQRCALSVSTMPTTRGRALSALQVVSRVVVVRKRIALIQLVVERAE